MSKKQCEIIRQDLIMIKSQLIDNPQNYIPRIINSLKSKKDAKLSNYEVDLALICLKQIYEQYLPETKKGGYLVKVKRLLANLSYNNNGLQYCNQAKSSNNNQIPITFRPIFSLLLEGLSLKKKPAFVDIISTKSKLSRSTIFRRFKRGTLINNLKIPPDKIILYKNNKITPSQLNQY